MLADDAQGEKRLTLLAFLLDFFFSLRRNTPPNKFHCAPLCEIYSPILACVGRIVDVLSETRKLVFAEQSTWP